MVVGLQSTVLIYLIIPVDRLTMLIIIDVASLYIVNLGFNIYPLIVIYVHVSRLCIYHCLVTGSRLALGEGIWLFLRCQLHDAFCFVVCFL